MQNTEKIKIREVNELIKSEIEDLGGVPILVRQYLETNSQGSRVEGKYFRIAIEDKHDLNTGAGIAKFNELYVKKRHNKKWIKKYKTGMMQYCGAYSHEIDDWDLKLNDPKILEESQNSLVYGIKTDTDNIKIYHLSKNGCLSKKEDFNIRKYEEVIERIGLLHDAIANPKAFGKYISLSENYGWWHGKVDVSDEKCVILDQDGKPLYNEKFMEMAEIIVIFAIHFDRDHDPIADYYKFYFWIKNHGICSTKAFPTKNHHPKGKNYWVGVTFEITRINREHDFAGVEVIVGNRDQKWKNEHEFRVEWKSPI